MKLFPYTGTRYCDRCRCGYPWRICLRAFHSCRYFVAGMVGPRLWMPHVYRRERPVTHK